MLALEAIYLDKLSNRKNANVKFGLKKHQISKKFFYRMFFIDEIISIIAAKK
jgi:hypothetical protein